MVTRWGGPRQVEVTGPDGLQQVDARAVVLATGARERPRTARLVPGTRPSGIFTTGQLQQWVHRERLPLSGRALIVGAEHVSYSAVLTLREAGVRPVALVTNLPEMQTFRPFDLATRVGLRVPVWTGTSVIGVTGRDRVDGVLVRGPERAERTVAVDVVVFSGDFIPDNELARLAHVAIDPGTNGPACDFEGATSAAGVFATGNLVHPAETADVAARRAVSVGAAVAAWLRGGQGSPADRDRVRLQVADPLLWVVPNLAHPGRAGSEPLLVRARVFLDRPRLAATQGGRMLGSFRPRRLIPNRSHALPSDWLRLVRPGEDVLLSVS
jgi:pyruvate/2-oxoglutarate dehydrogenase complex dihydrolipoamide dehydrogenase (E3) component